MEEVRVEAGAFILHKDSPARSVLLVEEGEVEVIEESLGQTVTLAVIKAGGVVGEVGFVDGRPRTNDVRARTDARLVRLTREKLLALVAGDPVVFGKIMMSLAELMAQRFRITLAEMEPVRAFAQSLDEPIDASAEEAASFDEIDEPLPDAADVVEVLRQMADASRRGRAQV
jgi:CRP-like cAMP-binding protein